MAATVNLLTIIFLLVFPYARSECFLTISELQLATPGVPQEFFELNTNCSLPLDLSPYTVVLWKGSKDKPARISNRIRFTAQRPRCHQLAHQFLVIGNNINASSGSLYCPFDGFDSLTEWAKGQTFWIDKGSNSINALVVYKGVAEEKLRVNETISHETAFRENIEDVVFFTKAGTGRSLKDYLMPEYDVGQVNQNKTGYYALKEEKLPSNISPDQRRSFTFCCRGSGQEFRQWPMGFRYGKPTPGASNDCSGVYCLDSVYGTFNSSIDRCDWVQVHSMFGTPEDKEKERNPIVAFIEDHPVAVGAIVGSVLAVIVVAAGLGITYHQRRRIRNLRIIQQLSRSKLRTASDDDMDVNVAFDRNTNPSFVP